MKLNELKDTNLFNFLSEQDQEVVAGGAHYEGPWGKVDTTDNSWQYTGLDGTKYLVTYAPFKYEVIKAA